MKKPWFAVFAIGYLSVLCLAYSGGDGTAGNPYQIADANDLNAIGLHSEDWDKCFILTGDIDMSGITGTQYNIIGKRTISFSGTFDGNGHIIRNLTYTTTDVVYDVGLFGYAKKATIKNLGVENVNISSPVNMPSTGNRYVGGLVGFQEYGTITNCYSTGSVNSSYASYEPCTGGLVGHQKSGTMTNCYSTALVTSFGSSCSAGGLVGWQSSGTIMNCYSMGSVTTSVTSSYSYSYAGGLAGHVYGTITNCYSAGSITTVVISPTYYSYVGGLAGYQESGTVTNCYSVGAVTTSGSGKKCIGGLVGFSGAVINSFWDIQTSGLDTSVGGTPRTTLQMKQAANYIGWNTPLQTYWTINEGTDYPQLAWQNQPGTPLEMLALRNYISGIGTESDPYRIYTPQELNLVGLFADEWNKVFCLEDDIDLSAFSGTEFNRIGVGEGKYFTGTFDGNGHTIFNLTYTTIYAVNYVGLFGSTRNATIRNLGLENVNIFTGGYFAGGLVGFGYSGAISSCYSTGSVTSSYSPSSSYIGGLAGYHYSGGIITNCYSTCSVISSFSSYDSCAGGLIGYQESGTITNCYSMGSVSCSPSSDDSSYVGGLVGKKDSGAISSCYSTGSVTSSSQYYSHAGGLVGYQGSGAIAYCYGAGSVTSSSISYSYAGGLVGKKGSGVITCCYSTGSVTNVSSSNSSHAGGLVGYQYDNSAGVKIEKCYCIGQVSVTGGSVYKGGLLGSTLGSGGTTAACFWDTQTSGITDGVGNVNPDPAGVMGRTASQMKALSTFTSTVWDFTNEITNGTNDIWRMCVSGVDYPLLNWQFAQYGDLVCPYWTNTEDLNYLVERWLLNNCISSNNYCGGADIDSSGSVDLNDFAVIARYWLFWTE